MTPEALLSAQSALVAGGACIFLLSTMAAYAGRCLTIGALDDAPGPEGPSMFPGWVRGWWRWLCSPLVRTCSRLGVPAEAIDALAFAAAAVAAVAIVTGSFGAGGCVYVGAAALGTLGGQLARRRAHPRRAATLVEGVLGRFAELVVLSSIAYAMRQRPGALAAALCSLAAATLAGDARLRAETLGVTLPSRAAWFGRVERALIVGTACALLPITDVLFRPGAGIAVLSASLGLVAVLAAASAARRVHTAHGALRTVDDLSEPRVTARRLRVVPGGRS